MILLFLFLVLILGALAVLVVSENPQFVTIYIAYFEITSTMGVTIVAAFGFGLLTGMLTMLSREVSGMMGGDPAGKD